MTKPEPIESSDSIAENPREYFTAVRAEARKNLKRLIRAEELVRINWEKGMYRGGSKRESRTWSYVLEVLRDKKTLLGSLVHTYRVRKKAKKS